MANLSNIVPNDHGAAAVNDYRGDRPGDYLGQLRQVYHHDWSNPQEYGLPITVNKFQQWNGEAWLDVPREVRAARACA
jgi:hypothetical protein